MANIKSQIKRNNRSQRERFENRHYTSQIKTYFRRLETAVTAGDDEQITAECETAAEETGAAAWMLLTARRCW